MTSLRRLRFSLNDLPPELDERARLALWREHQPLAFDTTFLDGRPPSATVEFVQADGMQLLNFRGTVADITRTPRHVAANPQDDLCLTFNVGRSAYLLRQNGRDATPGTWSAVLHTNGEPYALSAKARAAWLGVGIERAKLAELIYHPEDLVVRAFDPEAAAMRHLGRYLRLIMEPDGIGEDAALDEHIGTTLIDLVALALGAGRDAAELARQRGRRAALLREIIAEIARGFADPALSPERVASKLRLSPRYLQDLLHESGRTFSERVMELRLQRARAMLATHAYDRLKVIEIAYACGFNEVSYFNRCFRRRFGDTPRHFRGNGGHDG